MNQIDYSSYSYTELLEAQSGIDKSKYPDRVAEIERQLELKKEQHEQAIGAAKNQQDFDFDEATLSCVNIFTYLQGISTLILLVVLINRYVEGTPITTGDWIVLPIVLGLGFVSTYISFKKLTQLYVIPCINQLIQIFSVSAGSIYWVYTNVGAFFVNITAELGSTIGFSFSANFYLLPNLNLMTIDNGHFHFNLAINIIAVVGLVSYAHVFTQSKMKQSKD